MATLGICLIVIGLVVLLALAASAFIIIYIGSGEPDCNGDPEKDGGISWPKSES